MALRLEQMVGHARRLTDLGEELAPQLYEAELNFPRTEEWARTGEDVLWRRSKLGLHLAAEQRERVDAWFDA